MDLMNLWSQFKEFFVDLVKYGFPTIAVILSLLSYFDAKKAKRIQGRLHALEEKLKNYELEDKEKERDAESKACIEARIIKISNNNYRVKFWNSGKATAYNVDFKIPEEFDVDIFRDKVPHEFLESGKNFEEIILVHGETPHKFNIITTWKDKNGTEFAKEQIITI